MKKKIWQKICVGLLVAGLALGAAPGTEAASRAELAAIHVEKDKDFHYWNKDAQSYQALVSYVKDVTNKKSRNYIPKEDRIAVFDLDGTLLGERTPCYFEWMLYLDRALNDPSFTPAKEDREYAQQVKEAIYGAGITGGMDRPEAVSQASVFAGMTLPEYEAYVKKFMETKTEGLSNLKWGEAFYLPMVEVVSYLNENDFKVFIVSGSDRQALRILVDGVLDIDKDNIIGTDAWVLASGQGEKDGLDYVYSKEDQLVRGQFVLKNVKMNKVSNIAREIGKQPVLAFGNSSGDYSMFNYTVSGNKYKAMAFSLCCDDLERELGDLAKADSMRAACEKNGWVPVSMRDDWQTIYGPDVKRVQVDK